MAEQEWRDFQKSEVLGVGILKMKSKPVCSLGKTQREAAQSRLECFDIFPQLTYFRKNQTSLKTHTRTDFGGMGLTGVFLFLGMWVFWCVFVFIISCVTLSVWLNGLWLRLVRLLFSRGYKCGMSLVLRIWVYYICFSLR